MLGELGVVGLGLLLVALAVPLVAAVRARHAPLVSAAFGAYVAYLVHAGVDWDWEMTAVTIAALFCGVAVIVEARRREGEDMARSPLALRITSLAGIAVLAAFSFFGLIGNIAISRSSAALDDSSYGTAIADAKRARFWAPWSAEPWRLLGEAQLTVGDVKPARTSLLKAISKDRQNWDLWLSLAVVSEGTEQQHALAEAERLNPLSDEVRQIKDSLK